MKQNSECHRFSSFPQARCSFSGSNSTEMVTAELLLKANKNLSHSYQSVSSFCPFKESEWIFLSKVLPLMKHLPSVWATPILPANTGIILKEVFDGGKDLINGKNLEDYKLLKLVWKWNYISRSWKHNSLILPPDRLHPPPGLTGNSRKAKLLAAHAVEPETRHLPRISSQVTWVSPLFGAGWPHESPALQRQ